MHRGQPVLDRGATGPGLSASVDFPHAGSGGHDDHLARVQTVGQLVELGEARGDAADRLPSREEMASISSRVGCISSDSGL